MAEEVSSIEGLSFSCESCQQIDSEACEYESLGVVQAIECNDLLERLLTASVLKGSSVDEKPSSSELGQFLIFKKRSETQARFALRLMLQRKEGRSLLEGSFDSFHSKYNKILEQELREDSVDKSFKKAIWSKQQFLSPGTRASIVNSVKDLNSSDFFETLSVADIPYDIQQLKEALKLEKSLDPDFVSDIVEAIRFLFECKYAKECQYDVADFPSLGAYSKRVQANKIVEFIASSKDLNSSQAIDLLSKIDYTEVRTPRMHSLLKQAYASQADKKAFTEKNLELVHYFSKYDTELKELLEASVKKPQKTSVKINPLYLIYPLILILTALLFNYFRKKSKQKRTELDDLKSYFGLEKDDSIDKLSDSYRKRARALHPDTENGDARAFAEMNERYQQAKKLMGSGK